MADITITFNFYSLLFKPRKQHSDLNSVEILRKVLHYVTPVNLENKAYLVDRYKNRENSSPRELFIDSVTFDHVERRYKCRMGVIREGKTPMLKPYDSYQLVSLDEMKKKYGDLVEVTHFYIDISKNKPYLCCEYNFYGPRYTDIEFYLRNVAHNVLELAKETKLEIHLDVSLDKLLNDLKDVFSFELKMEPSGLELIEPNLKNHYFTGLSSFGRLLSTRAINIKAFFDVFEGNKLVKTDNEGTSLVKKLLRSIKNQDTDMNAFKNFILEYTTDQSDDIQYINLIKNQKGFEISIDKMFLNSNKRWYELVKPEIDNFINGL
ncbi:MULTISPECIES: hypothetical protein [Olivibacter]|uniref:ATP-grasp domain-containing protein n=3 Tax=Olivibacter TaxID=376469 RepID=A0ABV6HHI3_9SPHI|nr:hypothetical protein [Olivibacter jilunii]